jgi:hypothetical protein
MSSTLAQIKLKNFQNSKIINWQKSKIFNVNTEKKLMRYPAYTIFYTKYELILSPLLYKYLFKKVKDESIWHYPFELKYIFAPINKIYIGISNVFDEHINSYPENIFNFFTFGQHKNKLKEIQHTYIIVETTDGDLLIEKNRDGIILKNEIRNDDYENTIIIDTKNKPNLCLYSLLCNTIDAYETTEYFYGYDLKKNNCQQFVMKILDNNGFFTQEIYKYVMQDELQYDLECSNYSGFFSWFMRKS